MSESYDLTDDVKAVAESFLIAGVHPNLRLVAEAALRADALESQDQALQERVEKAVREIRDAMKRIMVDLVTCVESPENHDLDAPYEVLAALQLLSPTQETDPLTCTHDDHKPCRDRACFFFGMDHCHPGD